MSETLYSDEIKRFLRQVPWTKGLVLDVIEYDTHLAIRLYRENFETFDGEGKKAISKLIGETINAVRKQGCPIYLEVAAGNGKQNGSLPNGRA